MRVARALRAAYLVSWVSCGAATTPLRAPPRGASDGLLTVLAPESETLDEPAVVTDGALGSGWYCSGARRAQRYEVMFRDGLPRRVRAVGFVLANTPASDERWGESFHLRIQRGHGAVAPGVSLRVDAQHARVRSRPTRAVAGGGPGGATRAWVLFSEPLEGDHVVLRFEGRLRRATARCVGELEVELEGEPATVHDDAWVLQAEREGEGDTSLASAARPTPPVPIDGGAVAPNAPDVPTPDGSVDP